MAFQPGLLDTGLPTRVLSQTKVDLATPVNIYTSLQANKRANQAAEASRKLSKITLTDAERKIQDEKDYRKILSQHVKPNGQVEGQKAIESLRANGLDTYADGIETRMMKSFQLQQEKQKYKQGINQQVGSSFLTALESENPTEALIRIQPMLKKSKWDGSKDIANYNPTEEEISTGQLNPKIVQGMKHFGEMYLTPEQRLARRKATGEGVSKPKEYGLKPIYGKKGNEIVAFQASKGGDLKQIEIPDGVTLTPGLQYQNIGNKIIGFDKSGSPVISVDKGIDPGKAADLVLKNKEDLRKAEIFEQKKRETARKNRSYIKKNKSQYDNFQRFVDKADSILQNQNMAYVSGAGRAHPTKGSEIPFIETVGKDLQADIDFLTDMGVIETMAKLKAESPTGSTGFGALNAEELRTMKNAFSLLGNPGISAKKKIDEVKKVRNIMSKRAVEIRSYMDEIDGVAGPEQTEEADLRSRMKVKR